MQKDNSLNQNSKEYSQGNIFFYFHVASLLNSYITISNQ